jgi:ABC-type sugar transport system permease subunit
VDLGAHSESLSTLTPRGAGWLSRNRVRFKRGIGITLFLLPAVVLYSLLGAAPIVLSIYLSLQKWNGLQPIYGRFNHFVYYHELFHDPLVGVALWNNVRAFVLFAGVSIPLALFLSFMLSRGGRWTGFFRTVYFIPSISSVLIIALVFRLFFTDDSGLNGLLRSVGLGGAIRPWFSDLGLSSWLFNVPQAWIYVGFWVVIFIAAIRGIDETLFEAATVDGAGRWRQFRDITVPSISGVLLFAYVMAAVFAVQTYIFQLIMPSTPGGPLQQGHTVGSYAAALVLNNGRLQTDWGYSSALSVLLIVMSSVASLMVLLVARYRRARAL